MCAHPNGSWFQPAEILFYEDIGEIGISGHALIRMCERGVSAEEFEQSILKNTRKLKAAATLLRQDRALKLTVGRLIFVIASHYRAEFSIVTVYRAETKKERTLRRERWLARMLKNPR